MSEELKPCPFCGGKPHRVRRMLDERFAYADEVTYQCANCGSVKSARGDTSKPGYADNSTVEDRAITAWNRRADAYRIAELERQLAESNAREAKDYSELLDAFNDAKAQNVRLLGQLAERDADAQRYQQLLCMSTQEAVELFAMKDIDAMEIQLDAAIKAQEGKEHG